jgi:hypothetical protein
MASFSKSNLALIKTAKSESPAYERTVTPISYISSLDNCIRATASMTFMWEANSESRH